jgi:hypothetical protein
MNKYQHSVVRTYEVGETLTPPNVMFNILYGNITPTVILCLSKVSSVSIVSHYKLDTTGVRSLEEVKHLSSSLCVHISSGDHPASCPMGTGGPFPGGVKRGLRVTLTSHPHLVPRSIPSRSCISSSPWHCMAIAGQILLKVHYSRVKYTYMF